MSEARTNIVQTGWFYQEVGRRMVQDNRQLDAYIAPFAATWAKATTAETYSASVRAFVEWFRLVDPDADPKKVTAEAINEWLDYLKVEHKASARTVSTRLFSIQAFFRYLVEEEIIATSPAAEIDPIAVKPAPSMPLLTRAELNRLINQGRLSRPADDALISLMATMALTVTQLCEILIEEIQHTQDGKLSIQLTTRTGDLVMANVPRNAQTSVERAMSDRESGPLLLRRDGSPMSRSSAAKIIKRVAKAAKLKPNLVPESVRQSCIALRVEDGVPVWILAEEVRLHEGSVRNHMRRVRRERTILN